MTEVEICPVCTRSNWETIGSLEYRKSDRPRSSYVRIRLDVLFNVWLPNCEYIKVNAIVCQDCGFTCYTPRPSEADLIAKYDYLSCHPDASKEFVDSKTSDRVRSLELFRTVQRHFRKNAPQTILDFGGGNGRLLSTFIEAGHKCSIVELEESIEDKRINYVGSSMSSIPPSTTYDLIIMSHVIEHLRDPFLILSEAKRLLREDSKIYIEVPCEIWRGIPPKNEPVTHINFFTKNSMRVILERSGYEVVMCKHSTFTRPNGLKGVAVKAICKLSSKEGAFEKNLKGPHLTYSLMNPNFLSRLLRLLKHPALAHNLLQR